MKKAFISGHQRFGEGQLLSKHGFGVTENIEEADLVVFTGGADISPAIYGEPTHGTTYPQAPRDDEDRENFIRATSMGIPILGICRGAQLICALTGGSLWQNISNHQGDHGITNKETGEVLITNSVHHQAMRPSSEAIIHWVSTHDCLGTRYDHVTKKFITESVKEVAEIITVPGIKAVAVQGHPEFDASSLRLLSFRTAVFKLVNEFQAVEAPTPSPV